MAVEAGVGVVSKIGVAVATGVPVGATGVPVGIGLGVTAGATGDVGVGVGDAVGKDVGGRVALGVDSVWVQANPIAARKTRRPTIRSLLITLLLPNLANFPKSIRRANPRSVSREC